MTLWSGSFQVSEESLLRKIIYSSCDFSICLVQQNNKNSLKNIMVIYHRKYKPVVANNEQTVAKSRSQIHFDCHELGIVSSFLSVENRNKKAFSNKVLQIVVQQNLNSGSIFRRYLHGNYKGESYLKNILYTSWQQPPHEYQIWLANVFSV